MKERIILALILGACLIGMKASAQDPYVDRNQLPSAFAQGENAAGGNVVNVDLYTGVPSVTIPICSRSADGLDVGVALSYNAKGIQVDQTASSVGIGWNISAGGYIIREVKGIEDEASFSTSVYHAGSPSGFYTPSFYSGILVNPSIGGTFETEHDIFTAVFGGRSVTFSFDGSGGISTSPHCQLNIQMMIDGVAYTHNLPSTADQTASAHYLTFVITDEHGNVFTFDRGDYEIKMGSDGNLYYPVDKWVLTKIATVNGNTVTFNYNTYSLNYKQYLLDTIIEQTTPPGDVTNFGATALGTVQQISWNGVASHISSIQYPDGTKVTFNLSDLATRCDLSSAPILKSITISNGYDATVTNSITYSFVQDYLNSIPGASSTTLPMSGSPCSYTSSYSADQLNLGLRLRLNQIVKIGTDGTTTEPYYSFYYNSTMLPPRLSISQDWYGYFNNQVSTVVGTDAQPIAVPWHAPDNGGVHKDPNVTYLQANILNKIVNAKGGEIDLYYQAPPSLSDPATSYPDDMDEARSTYDGLCIDHIDYKDGYNSDNNSTTTYNFSNGYRFYPGAYFWYPTSYLSGAISERKLTNHMVTPMDYFHGCNHGYSGVSVNKTGYLGEHLSRVDYAFSNILDASSTSYLADDQTQATYHSMTRASMDQPQMGLLQSISNYGNTGTIPVKQTLLTYTTHNYTPLQSTSNFVFPNLILAYETAVPGSVAASRTYNVFNSEAVNVASKTESVNEGGAALTSTTNYTYDSYDQLSAETYLNTKGRLMTHQYFHNYDYNFTGYTFTGPTDPASIVNTMNNNHLQLVLADERRQNSNWPTFSTTPTPDSIISFSQWLPNYAGGVISVSSTTSSTITAPVPTTTFHHHGSGFFNDNAFYNYNAYASNFNQMTKYDDHYDVLESWTDNHQKCTSYIWDTRIGKKVATVANAQYSEIAYTSFEGGFAPWGTADFNKGNWDFLSPYITVGTSVKPMTGRYYLQLLSGSGSVLSQITTVSGKRYLLSFWSTGGVPAVNFGGTTLTMQAQNTIGPWTLYTCYFAGDGASNVQIYNSGSAAIGLDELRLIPANAIISTATYEPFIGINSESDERNNITYYEYDAMGRLKVTRDINGNIIVLQQTTIQGAD